MNDDDFPRRVSEAAAQLAAHGVAALGGLIDLASPRLVRFSCAITRHQHDAEDAVQAALVRVARAPRLLAGADSPWAYLLQMVRNESLAIARRKKRWTTAVTLADLATQCPIDEVEQEESRRAVWRAIRKLPPEQAEVVVLKIWEGMTFAQIGKVLETSANTAASRYQYAMVKLAAKLLREGREVQS